MKEPIFLRPSFQERIWGGNRLRAKYGYQIPSENTGECWAISAHQNGESVVRFGPFEGMTLAELWAKHKRLFGYHSSEKFPLLTKILDANDDLSVQVHPDDAYAKTYENGELGKTECWYIIDCEKDAELILGHTAKTKKELIEMMKERRWDRLLQRVKIKPGDFFYVPSGTIHALCKGTLVLETQQSSDTTYRVYDYNRRDKDGKLRDLHIDKAIDVTTISHQKEELKQSTIQLKNATITTFVKNHYFTVYKWSIHNHLEMEQNHGFQVASVLNGEGTLVANNHVFTIRKGDHFILPYEMGQFELNGELELIVAHP
ncbi:mannose-6-phosphate isomerase, class I [Bacillus timonensis]|nr:mannose-6-phosphate isomerase, class I [Bacillus timonensis]